jgi:micrococcal nuclease
MKKNSAILIVMVALTFACSKKQGEPEKKAEESAEVTAPQSAPESGQQAGKKEEPAKAAEPESAAPKETYAGKEAKVVKVVKADTVVVKEAKKQYQVRLYGVELSKNTSVNNKAKQFITELLLNKEVLVDPKGKNKFGLPVAMVSLPPGPNANHELVREGYAMWDQKTAKDEYARQLQDQARTAKKGLWGVTRKKG